MPILDLNIFPTHNRKTMAIGDNSYYEPNLTINSPSLTVIPPGWPTKIVVFTPKSLNVFNSYLFGITTVNDITQLADLPDGYWQLTYSVYPPLVNFVNINFYKIDLLEERYYNAYLFLSLTECDTKTKSTGKKQLEVIDTYIQACKAAGMKCDPVQATAFYTLADRKLNQFFEIYKYGMSTYKV